MDFFEAQDESRRITRLLIVFFVLAVVSIVILTNLLVLAVSGYTNTEAISTGGFRYDWMTFAGVTVIVVLLIGLGSGYRILSLSKGGSKIAEMMHGKLLADHGGDLKRRQLLNVVEEMSIASGTPVPPVYLIADQSINAFAAGYSSGDAVIGITQGALDNLTRDQLQGVIAHEFSHILNGDMRMNIRLMGVLFGILMLAVIGRVLLYSGRGARVGSSRKGSGGGIMALAIGLLVIGFVGKFFGSIIKAAVSRQREFLADASAVQFTRDRDGISGALMRIGGYAPGSVLEEAEAEEYSHAFFSQGVKTMFSSVMATHPPLAARISRIRPDWDGAYITEPPPAPVDDGAPVSGFAAGASALNPATSMAGIDADAALSTIGQPGQSQLDQARSILASIPTPLADAAREAYSARAVVYLVLLDRDELIRRRQEDELEASADPFVWARFRELLAFADDLTDDMRLPLVEMALPSLRQLSTDQHTRFLSNIDALIRADQSVSLSEWALKKYLTRNLEAAIEGKHSSSSIKTLAEVKEDCAVLLSCLAYSDRDAGVSPVVAFAAGVEELGEEVALVEKSELRLTRLNDALDRLATLRPLRKPKLLKACMATITADRKVATVEKELIRAIADSLACPMPPFDRV